MSWDADLLCNCNFTAYKSGKSHKNKSEMSQSGEGSRSKTSPIHVLRSCLTPALSFLKIACFFISYIWVFLSDMGGAGEWYYMTCIYTHKWSEHNENLQILDDLEWRICNILFNMGAVARLTLVLRFSWLSFIDYCQSNWKVLTSFFLNLFMATVY